MSQSYLTVAPWKFMVLKLGYLANICFMKIKFPQGNYQLIVPQQKHYCLLVFCFILVETFPALLEMFHSLDVWHKAKKLTKALHRVFNTHNKLLGEPKNVLCFGYMWTVQGWQKKVIQRNKAITQQPHVKTNGDDFSS